VSERYGSRFTDGGYQAPSTNAAALHRGRPLRSLSWTIGTERVELAIVPLEGGRPELFEIEYKRNDPVAKSSVYTPCLIRGLQDARTAFARTAAELDAGRLPEIVLTPPGAHLGP
jgi:hypothetical protein